MRSASSRTALPDAAGPAKKKSRLDEEADARRSIVLLILGGAGGWWMTRGKASAERPSRRSKTRGLLTFEPFLVNLADRAATRFLKVTVQLVVASDAEAKHIEQKRRSC